MGVVCPGCGNENIRNIGKISCTDKFAGKQLEELLPGGNLCRCNTCNLYFRYPHLSKEQLDQLYSQISGESWHSVVEDRQDWRLSANWIMSHISDEATVLDVGCFDGAFLDYLGSNYKRYGIEINDAASEKAKYKNIQIIGSDFIDIEKSSLIFDVIVAMDVIEHIENPLSFLKTLVKSTRPGGVIIITTGNTSALSWRFMGSRYWYCALTEHISFINPQWCNKTASKCGLIIESIETFSHANSHYKLHDSVKATAKNILFRLLPFGVGWLRRLGFGVLNVQKYKSLAYYPFDWTSAKDHFMVVLRKVQ